MCVTSRDPLQYNYPCCSQQAHFSTTTDLLQSSNFFNTRCDQKILGISAKNTLKLLSYHLRFLHRVPFIICATHIYAPSAPHFHVIQPC